MYNIGNKIVICQPQNPKSNFPKFLYIHLVETFALVEKMFLLLKFMHLTL